MNTTLRSLLEVALAADRAHAVESKKNAVAAQLLRVQEYAKSSKDGKIKTSFQWSYYQWSAIRGMTRDTIEQGPYHLAGHVDTYSRPLMRSLDDALVQRWAEQEADLMINSCIDKLCKKLGALDSAEVLDFYGFQRFTVTGVLNGHRVRVEQSMILNVSPKGKLFNQFPALIYVDGKKTPESRFAAATA